MTAPTGSIEQSPARLSSVASVIAALVAALVGIIGVQMPVWAGITGVVIVVVGLVRVSRFTIQTGSVVLVTGVLLGGVAGGSAVGLLMAMVATIVSWDLGEHAITLGEQLGPAAQTARLELVHLAGSLGVGGLAAGVVTLLASSGGGRPLSALVVLLIGIGVILVALRDRPTGTR